MILAVAATEIEMAPFVAALPASAVFCRTLVTGVGPVATTLRLTRFLCANKEQFDMVIQFGVGGAYLLPDQSRQPQLLDICLAEQEVAGDFGICLGDAMEYLNSALTGEIIATLDAVLLQRCRAVFDQLGIPYHPGVFITVNGVSGTRVRGEMLRARWNGLCENMEGLAVVSVCREFSLPCAELRCISNYVEDREPSSWRLPEACQKAADAAIQLIRGLTQS
jgi:futalosine hydrolase